MHREPVKSSENNSNPFLLSNLELDYESMEKAEDLNLYKSDGCGCATRIGYVERKTTFNTQP